MKTMYCKACLFGLVTLAAPLVACDPEPAADPARAPAAGPLRLLPAAEGDLAAPEVSAAVPPPPPATDRAPVTMTWPIDQSADDLADRPAPHRAESRAWWRLADRVELAAGVALPISVPGALIKLSPQDGAALDLDALELVAPDGAVLPGADALQPLADPEHLQAAGLAFSPGTAIFALRPELGAGEFTLRGASPRPVLVYVLERGAPTVLSLAPASDLAFTGAAVPVVVHLRDGEAVLRATSIAGAVIAPDGTRVAFDLAPAGDGGYRGEVVAPARGGPPGALLTVEVDVRGNTPRGRPVRRTASGALAVSPPTARYAGPAEIERARDGGLRVRLAVEVGAASRFGAGAVLHGTTSRGDLQPIAVAQAARWLDPGAGELALEFDAATLAAAGPGAPYELRDLRLVDQGRVHVLHRQARALAIADAIP